MGRRNSRNAILGPTMQRSRGRSDEQTCLAIEVTVLVVKDEEDPHHFRWCVDCQNNDRRLQFKSRHSTAGFSLHLARLNNGHAAGVSTGQMTGIPAMVAAFSKNSRADVNAR